MTNCSVTGISGIFSTLSLTSWVCAQLPQIIANYKAKSAEGISPLFLLLWLMGDILSFTSCLLNDAALNFQVYLSIFFLANDITLCYQFYYYNNLYIRAQYNTLAQNEESPKILAAGATHSTEIHGKTKAIHLRQLSGHQCEDKVIGKKASSSIGLTRKNSIMSSSPRTKDQFLTAQGFGSTGSSPKLGKMTIAASIFSNSGLAHAFNTKRSASDHSATIKETIGIILAWGCMCVYVGSRCPQLYKNYLRKSVDGISPLLFGSALLGNITYSLSVLTSCDFLHSENKLEFFFKQLPYLLGSAGTILFDIAYFYQRYIYRVVGTNYLYLDLEDWHEA